MGGLLRNGLTLLLALCSKRRMPNASISTFFLITPIDVGIAKLKSDRYLRLTEAAQIDFMACTRLFLTLLHRRYSFVNAAVLIRFAVPIRVLSWVTIESRVIYQDERFAYFEHLFVSQGRQCACVLVKMKFKQARYTINPGTLLGSAGYEVKPDYLHDWDRLLDQSWS